MRLTTKLFLFVGLLLLGICVVVYIVPAYLTTKQLELERAEYLRVVKEQRVAEQAQIAELLSEDVGSLAGEIDAALLLASGHGELKEALLGKGPGGAGGVWHTAAQLLSYTEAVDFLEIDSGGEPHAVITLGNAELYVAKPFPIGQDLAWILLDVAQKGEAVHDEVYMGVWLPSRQEQTAGTEEIPYEYTTVEIYLLFDPLLMLANPDHYSRILKESEEELKKLTLPSMPAAGEMAVDLLVRLDKASKFLQETFGESAPENLHRLKTYLDSLRSQKLELPLRDVATVGRSRGKKRVSQFLNAIAPTSPPPTPVPEGEEEVFWWTLTRHIRRSNDLELLGAMGLLAATGVMGDTPYSPGAPVGAARILPHREVGSAVLGRDVFSKESLFDPKPLFKQHPPLTATVPISSGFELIAADKAHEETIVNSLVLEVEEPGGQKEVRGFLTLGATFTSVMAKLAEQTNETTILLADGKVSSYVDRKTAILTQAIIDDLNVKGKKISDKLGFIHLDDKEFYYARYPIEQGWNLSFLTIQPASEVLDQIEEFEARSQAMANSLTWHIMLAAVIVFVIALIVLELLARQFTKPIRHLAEATEQVAAGQYDKVELPKVKESSRNEISILTTSFGHMVAGLRDREKIRSVLDKVVSKEIADEILEGKIHLGGEVKEVTVLFADIRNFTQMTENLGPDEVITFVNSYMTCMTEVIERHQGVIDKYIGDEIMALFGAPVEHPYSVLQAVLSALIIQRTLGEWNEERREQGLIVADVGIGVHCGPMVVGNMGAEDRLNYTVLGKNVNLAARLGDEAAPKEIWVTQEVLEDPHVQGAIKYEEREPVRLKGITEPVRVFLITGLRPGFLMGALSEETRKGARKVEE